MIGFAITAGAFAAAAIASTACRGYDFFDFHLIEIEIHNQPPSSPILKLFSPQLKNERAYILYIF